MRRPRVSALAVSVVVAAASCAGGELDAKKATPAPAPSGMKTPTGTTSVGGDGGYSVRVSESPPTVTLLRGETTLLAFPVDALQLGTVTALDDAFNYDPYFMAIGKTTKNPEGLVFVSPTSAKLVSTSPATLALTYDGGTATVTVKATATGSFEVVLVPAVANVAYFRLRPRVDPNEGLYGLGENFDDVNNRGKVRPMQLEAGGGLMNGYTLTHVPIPFVTGTRGWGLFVASQYPAVFDVAASATDIVEATFATGLASPKGLTFHLFAADPPAV